MSLLSSRKPRDVLLKSRGRIFGKKKSTDEIRQEIAELAKSGMDISKIAEVTGKDRTTIWRYLRKAEQLNEIVKTDTGRVEASPQTQLQKQHEMMQRDDFVRRYPSVQKWFEKRIAETKGNKNKIVARKSQLSALKTVCDTLQINPYQLLMKVDGLAHGGAEQALTQFANMMMQGKVSYATKRSHITYDDDISTRFRNYSQAVRSFCMANGIIFPEKIEGVLSGKKINYGKYAHVKLSFKKIDEIVQELEKKYGYASLEQALFVFYYLTCARKEAGLDVKVDNIVKHESGWLTCQVHETKTNTTWTKFIPDDNPHKKIFLDFLEKRKGKEYLFGDSEHELNRTSKNIASKFKSIYKKVGITEMYFEIKPIHALRHVGAHYWLARTGYNHSIVAKIGGWKTVQTLIDCYGQIPEDFIIKSLMKYKNDSESNNDSENNYKNDSESNNDSENNTEILHG